MRGVKRNLIPMESLPHAAFRRWMVRFLFCDSSEFFGHNMLRVPKLPRSTVSNTCQCASTWLSPVGSKNRFPNHENSHLLVRVTRKKLLCCGRPPQTTRSSRGQQQHHSRNSRIGIKGRSKFAQGFRRENSKWFLTGRHRRWPPQIHASQKQCDSCNSNDYCSLLHFQNRSAITAAISWGKRIIPNTTTTAAQSKTLPTSLPRTVHCLERCCCQNPKPSKITDNPKSHGRSVVANALAVPAPNAPAKAIGRQQLIVATELTIAANEAEMPVPCFIVVPPAELPLQPDEQFPLAEDRFASTRDKDGT